MIGATEICGIPVATFFLFIWLLYRYFAKSQQGGGEEQVAERHSPLLAWQNEISCPIWSDLAAEILCKILTTQFSWKLEAKSDQWQSFRRGDRSISKLSTTRDLRWHEVPVTLGLNYARREDGAAIWVAFVASKHTRFSADCVEFFRQNAALEFDALVRVINEVITECCDEQRQEEASDRSSESSSEYVYHECTRSQADYQELGLDVAASWVDVQAAYRRLCKQFHPDTLSSQNLPPHLLDLATSKFKSVTSAYQRIRSHVTDRASGSESDVGDVVKCPNCGRKNRIGEGMGVYRCRECGSVVRDNTVSESRESGHEAETASHTAADDKYREGDREEPFPIEEEDESEALTEVEVFCKMCPDGVIRIGYDSEEEKEEWYSTAGVECPNCGQFFMVRDLISLSEFPSE